MTSGSLAATRCGLDFFGTEHVLFASDCPFDPEGGTMYPRVTLQILDSLKLPKADQDKIYFQNLERITDKKLVN